MANAFFGQGSAEMGQTGCKNVRRLAYLSTYGCAQSLLAHKQIILNYFHNRATNASAVSFNAKIKGFKAIMRAVSDQSFFLFLLTKLFA